MLSPASLTLKFDAILDVPEGDEALSDSTLPLLFRPLSPRPISSVGFPCHEPAPIVIEEIIVSSSPLSGASTLVASPASNGHGALEDPPSYISSSGSTRSHGSGRHYRSTSSGSQHVYAQPARSVRSSGSVATARPRYERAKSSGVKMTVIPATPRRVSRGSVVSYRPERDEQGKLKFSTKLRRLFGLGPKREEVKAERGRTQYVYPSSSSSTHRRSTSRVVYSS